jgi:phosphatidylglycerophosphate synthase
MIDAKLRQAKELVLTPAAHWVGSKVDPNAVTLTAGMIGLFAALAAWQGQFGLGLGLWLLNRILDGLDGTLARIYRKQSDLGAYADILIDFVIYFIIPFGLALGMPSLELFMALIFMLGAFYVNAASYLYLTALLERRRQGAAARGELTSITMPGGLIEGTEAVVFYSLFFLFHQHLTILFALLGLLVVVTTLQRWVWAQRHL